MIGLDWLPVRPDHARAISDARLASAAATRLAAAIELAGFRRDALTTLRLDRLAQDALPQAGVPDGFQHRRMAVLASSTVEHLVPAIRVAGLQRRLVLDVTVAPYGQYRQVLLDPRSWGADEGLDFVLLSLDEAAALPPFPLTLGATEAAAAVRQEVDALIGLWRQARQRFGATVLQQTVLNTRLPLFGSHDAVVPGAPAAQIDRLNEAIRTAAAAEGVLLVDVDRHAAWDGSAAWADPVRWHHAKQAVSPAAAPLYGDVVARVIAAAMGLSRKCLVLDLDNTLWGGVVGDDGLEGIVLGQGSAAGEAFLAFQRFAVSMARRGIVLALCSKNERNLVETVFERHPEMLLKREDVAAVAINWDDKATNLRRIARQLEFGLDALVFVDDNPAERAIVRRELPMVAVPELPDDVARYAATIARAGYFEAVAFTSEDGMRASQYADNARRSEALAATTDMDGYLGSLEMVLEARRPGDADLARVTQLINKTNQFNLTTRRYSEGDVRGMLDDPETILLRFRLTDRFGDNGIIAVIISRRAGPGARSYSIDSWLMSCRVLGRGVEAACLGVLARAVTAAGATTLIGEYRPTARNAMVRDHYETLGFQPRGQGPDGETYWQLDIANHVEATHHMRVVG